MVADDVIFADNQESHLLDGEAVPRAPAVLAPGEETCVAVWRDGDMGALMLIHHDPDDGEEPYSVDIQSYERVAGRWRWTGTGGSDWPTSYGVRPERGRPSLTGFASGQQGADRWLWTGWAPIGVDQVRLRRPDGSFAEADVEPVTGAFLVDLDGSGEYEVG